MQIAFLVNCIYDPPHEPSQPWRQPSMQQHCSVQHVREFGPSTQESFEAQMGRALNDAMKAAVEEAHSLFSRNREVTVTDWTFKVGGMIRLD